MHTQKQTSSQIADTVANQLVANTRLTSKNYRHSFSWLKLVAAIAALLTLTIGLPTTALASSGTFTCGTGDYTVVEGVADGGRDCTGSFTIDSSATSIAYTGFYGSSIASITIPSTVLSIGESAFYSSRSLVSVTILGSGLQTIGNTAFYSSDSLTAIAFPSSLTSIGTNAFYGNHSLNSITFAAGSAITSISATTFYGAYTVRTISLPNSLTSIGSNAFYGASGITALTYCGPINSTGLAVAGLERAVKNNCAPGAPSIGTATATGTTTATVSFTSPASDGGSTILSYTATSNPGSITATITQAGSGTISVTGLSPATSYTFTITALNNSGPSPSSGTSNSITTYATGISPLFSSASSYDGRFTVQIKDYDEAFTYEVTASAGSISVNATGLITVNSLSPDQTVTVTVTTTRTGYGSVSGSITGRSQVAPMLPTNKPTVIITDTAITCTIGSYSATPTSSAFSLFVDGKHVSTIFSAVGEFLPDWIIPWATSSTITRTATLTSATWTVSDAYKGKAITCATLAYSKNAIGFTASQVMVAR